MSENELKTTDNIFDDIYDLIASGENNKTIAKVVNAKYDKNYNANSAIIKKTREKFVATYETPDREHYFKESLIDYDKIKDETDNIGDRKEALKLKLSALHDRDWETNFSLVFLIIAELAL